MTKQEFERFYNLVEKANKFDNVWWQGWAFTRMTRKQQKKISDLLTTKDFIDQIARIDGRTVTFWHILPSGAEVRRY